MYFKNISSIHLLFTRALHYKSVRWRELSLLESRQINCSKNLRFRIQSECFPFENRFVSHNYPLEYFSMASISVRFTEQKHLESVNRRKAMCSRKMCQQFLTNNLLITSLVCTNATWILSIASKFKMNK